LIGTESGCAGRLASVLQQAGALAARFAHADDAAAAGLHAGATHTRSSVSSRSW
jgi:hypothetical protein